MFYLKDGVVWIQVHCYRSQKKHDTMHEAKAAIANEYPQYVVRAVCTCVAGKARICSLSLVC